MINKIGYFTIFILLFFSADSLSSSIMSEQIGAFITQILYLILMVLLLVKIKNYEVSKKGEIVVFLSSILILVTAIINEDYTLGYFIQTIVLFTGYVITKKIDFHFFVDKYSQIIYYLSVLSLTLFFLFLFFPYLINIFSVSINSTEAEYVNLFFYVHYINMNRNTGIFREPGVYMIYLNVAVLFQYFYYQKINKKYLAVFVGTILSTLSTGGFVVFAFLSIVYLFNKNKIKNVLQFASVFIAICVIILNNFELFESTFLKFDSNATEYGNTVARISSVTIPFEIFKDNPFIGVGLSNFNGFYKIYSRDLLGYSLNADGQSTNTLFNSLATYGFFFFLILAVSIYRFSTKFSNKSIVKIGIFISLVLMLSNEDLRYSLFFSVLIFYGLNHYER